jgi:hypothetical protein
MSIAGVLFLAVIDSINPSAIVVTLWLLSVAREQAPVQVVGYVGAIFVTYLTAMELESGARGTMLWVAGLVGGWLFVTGTIELVARLR